MIANVSAAYAKDNKKALHLREHLKGEEFWLEVWWNKKEKCHKKINDK
jgi:hypothetical protein